MARGNGNKQYNETVTALRKGKAGYNYTWFVNAEVLDKLQSIKLGDMIVVKMVNQEGPNFKPGISPEAYLEYVPKERLEQRQEQKQESSEEV